MAKNKKKCGCNTWLKLLIIYSTGTLFSIYGFLAFTNSWFDAYDIMLWFTNSLPTWLYNVFIAVMLHYLIGLILAIGIAILYEKLR